MGMFFSDPQAFEALSIKVINPSTRYHFIRTKNGKYYNEFREKGYIAIGWNSVTPALLKMENDDPARRQIAVDKDTGEPSPDPLSRSGKQRITRIYNTLTDFINMKVPSKFIWRTPI